MKTIKIGLGAVFFLMSLSVKAQDVSAQTESIKSYINEFKKTSNLNAGDITKVKEQITSIRDVFLRAVEDEGFKNPYTPQIEIILTPSLMSFLGDTSEGYLIAPSWGMAHKEMKELMNMWVQEAGSTFTGEEFFKKNFNWFLVPHELGHFIQMTQNVKNLDYNDLWEGELYANKVAVAFWLKQGMEEELKEFITETTLVMELLGSPNSTRLSEKEFFNKNYIELGSDPGKYGYYQFLLYKQAWAQKDNLNSFVIINNNK